MLTVTVNGVSGVGTLGLAFAAGNIVDDALNEDALLVGVRAPAFINSTYTLLPPTAVTIVTAAVADGTYLVGAAIPFQVGFFDRSSPERRSPTVDVANSGSPSIRCQRQRQFDPDLHLCRAAGRFQRGRRHLRHRSEPERRDDR